MCEFGGNNVKGQRSVCWLRAWIGLKRAVFGCTVSLPEVVFLLTWAYDRGLS